MCWRFNMEATAILDKLHSLGIGVTVSGDKLRLEPGSSVPKELVEELKAHKPEVLCLLKLRGYRLRYPGNQVTDQELTEIEARVERDGYVLLWSNALNDFVAFYKTEADREKIPPVFVPYSLAELDCLFGHGKPPASLKLIHEAKKLGGRVVDNESC
jgi:hypothetical protein